MNKLLLLAILATSVLSADTITSALIFAQVAGPNSTVTYSFAGPAVFFSFTTTTATGGPNPTPVNIVGPFGVYPVFDFNFSTSATGPLDNGLGYGGVEYSLSQPYSFSMNLTVQGTASAGGYPPGFEVGDVYSNGASRNGPPMPFTLTGSATFEWNGQPIFTNLPLSGSGLAGASTSSVVGPFGASTVSNSVYAVGSAVNAPEPAAFPLVLSCLAGLGLAIRRRRA